MLRIIRTTRIASFSAGSGINRVEEDSPMFEVIDLKSKKPLAIGKGSPRYCRNLLVQGLKTNRWAHDTPIEFLYRRDTDAQEMARVTVKEFCRWADEAEDIFDTTRQEVFGPRTKSEDN